MEGPTVSLAKWAMAGYLAATGTAPENDEELALLIGTTKGMARRIMDAAARICPEGHDPVPALARVTAPHPQDGEADTAPPEPRRRPRRRPRQSGKTDQGTSPQNAGSSGAADQPEKGQPASGADILSPDG